MKFNCQIDPELQEYLEEQYKEYIKVTPMTKKEQRHLREWVKNGHSVRQSPGSKYLCEQYPPLDFLDNYRQDQEIEQAIKGMTDAETEKYLKEYMGYEDEDHHEDIPQKTPEEHIHDLEHESFFLWDYIRSEGLWVKAAEYLQAHKDEEIPFGYEDLK